MGGDLDISGMDQRARSAGYSDGLLEIFAAIVLTTIALTWLVSASLVGIVAAFVALYGWKVVDRVRARVTYPRIGYFRERSDEPSSTARGMLLFIGGAFLLMVLAVLISGGLDDASQWRRAAPLLSGLSLFGGFWYTGEKSGYLRYRIIALLSVVSGVLLWWFGSGESYDGVVWHLLSLVVPLAVIGIWALRHFLKTYPIQDQPGDE